MQSAYVGIAGSHINAIGSKGVVAVGRSGRSITQEDIQRALEQARNIALPHNREIIHAVPRTFCVDDQKGIQNPVGMFGYRLEVDASIITGASSAVTNLVNCVQANGVAIDDLVLQPLASGEAVLTDDERQLGVALVDIGGGTSDIAIYLDGAPWHTVVIGPGGDHFVKDVAVGLRMPYGKAEALMKQFGHVLPEQVPADAEVRSGAFGQDGQQTVNCRLLAEILNARAEELVDLIVREVKRSGYDGLLPAGHRADRRRCPACRPGRAEPEPACSGRCASAGPAVTITFGHRRDQPGVRDGGRAAAVGFAAGHRPPCRARTPASRFLDRVMKWLRALLTTSSSSSLTARLAAAALTERGSGEWPR